MPEVTTLGRELIRAKLPDKYKHYASGVLDKKGVTKMMTDIGLHDPDLYVDILQDVNNIGQAVVSTYGRDAALPYADARVGKAVLAMNRQLGQLKKNILNDTKLTGEQKEEALLQLGYKYMKKVQDAVMEDNNNRRTALASQVNSGSRGKPVQLMQLQFGNMMMVDALNRPIPYVHTDPFISGTSPMSYWVSASSGRKGNYDVQAATGQAGYMGKQVTSATHATPIVEEDCGTDDTGVAFKAADSKNVGAVLLRPFHNHPAGSIVTDDMVSEADDDEEMILRSPLTCKSAHGVCQKCNGLGENGHFPAIGEYVALSAARSFVEPITQAGVGCLHPDTLVRMADWSIKPIKDIEVGDTVIGVDETGTCSPVKVTHVFDNGMKDMYLTTYRKGYKTKSIACLVSTLNHKALQCTLKTGCKDAANNNIPRILPVGYKTKSINMVTLQKVGHVDGRQVDEALFLGLMLGDGCYTDGVQLRPHFSCADPSLIADTESYMQSIGLRFAFHKGSECYYRVVNANPVNVTGKVRELNPAKQYLAAHNLLGKYAYEKELPSDYLTWNSESASALLSGLIITDGCITWTNDKRKQPRFEYATTSPKLAVQIVQLINRYCGITISHITSTKSARKRTLYKIHCAKQIDLKKLLSFVHLYGVKEPRRLRALQDIATWETTATVAEKQNSWKRLSSRYVGKVQALDIEVDCPSHLFLLANGLVVSNSKHAGGVGGAKAVDPEGEDQPTGFPKVEQFLMAPSTFQGAAVLAQEDGTVGSIREAPQGGHYITVGQQTLYANPYRTITVKPGDKVTAGDRLTNGVPNPMELVSLKGVGAGRKYFTTQLNDILGGLGWGTDRRNLESFGRAMISKVRITDPDGLGSWLPDDVVDYNEIQASWQPREDAVTTTAKKAVGKYLERPVLNYTIGTRITPAVADDLEKHQFSNVTVNDRPLPFESVFLRPANLLQNDEHWLPRLAGERLRDSLFDATRRGLTDEYDSTSYVDKILINPYKPN